MPFEKAVLAGIYVPLIIASIFAMCMYGGSVLMPAIREKKLSVEDHGIVIGMFLLFMADMIENSYYWVGRLYPEQYSAMGWSIMSVLTIKLIILLGALYAIAGWMKSVYKQSCITCLIAISGGLWAMATMFFSVAWKL